MAADETKPSVALGLRELESLLDEMDALLKNPDVGGALAGRGVNISLALVAVDGLRAYVKGDKERAVEDLGTFTEEVKARLATARELAKSRPS